MKNDKQTMIKKDAKYSIISEYYTTHLDEVRMFVGSRIKNAPETDDIVQDIFLKLLSTDGVLVPNTLTSLIYTIARNKIFDFYRHKRSIEEYSGFVGLYSVTVQPASSIYSEREIYEILENGIAHLKESQRCIYRMNIYGGLAVSDISKVLNIKYKTVENKLGLARKEIRQYLTKMFA